jgi:protein involved in polysaccharide export with SLBB domain
MVSVPVSRRLALLLPLLAAGCGINAIDLPPPPPEPPVYRLAAGDKVAVQVFGQPDMSGQFDVNADGMLLLPLVGAVPARDRTLAEVSQDLKNRLDRFIVNPQFTVDVVTYRQIFVLGEVSKPGGYPYSVGLTVQQAVALAGGFTRRAITDKVAVTRLTDAGPREYGLTVRDTLAPGDTVNVQRRVF